ncbi:MAG: hypothetical protein WD554_06860 [Flavobacteriaceae bacterium]
MKKVIYTSGIIILIGVLTVIIVSVKLYNKPHTDVLASKPDYEVSAKEIINDFSQNEAEANKKYLDQIVQIEGQIKDINTTDGNTVITLSSESSTKNIICTMEPSENKKTFGLATGQKITIKGICTGFLFDVIIVRAVIVN